VRTVAGVFDEIEQRSYYPYYPFQAHEQALLLDGLDRLLAVMKESEKKTIALPGVETPLTLEEVTRFRGEIERITEERGPQTPEGQSEEE